MFDLIMSEPLSEREKREIANMIYTLANFIEIKKNKLKKSMALNDEDVILLASALNLVFSCPSCAKEILKSRFNAQIISC